MMFDSFEKNVYRLNETYIATWKSELTQLLTSLQERSNNKTHFHLTEEAKHTHTKKHEKI